MRCLNGHDLGKHEQTKLKYIMSISVLKKQTVQNYNNHKNSKEKYALKHLNV